MGENFRKGKIVFTTPPDATIVILHYLYIFVKKKYYRTDLPGLLYRIEVVLSGLIFSILNFVGTNYEYAQSLIPEFFCKVFEYNL